MFAIFVYNLLETEYLFFLNTLYYTSTYILNTYSQRSCTKMNKFRKDALLLSTLAVIYIHTHGGGCYFLIAIRANSFRSTLF